MKKGYILGILLISFLFIPFLTYADWSDTGDIKRDGNVGADSQPLTGANWTDGGVCDSIVCRYSDEYPLSGTIALRIRETGVNYVYAPQTGNGYYAAYISGDTSAVNCLIEVCDTDTCHTVGYNTSVSATKFVYNTGGGATASAVDLPAASSHKRVEIYVSGSTTVLYADGTELTTGNLGGSLTEVRLSSPGSSTNWCRYDNVSFVEGAGTPVTNYFELQAFDAWNGSVISNFNATFSNSTENVTYYSTDGNVTPVMGDGYYNISIVSSDNGGYFKYTLSNYFTDTDINIYMTKYYNLGVLQYSNYTTFSDVDYVRKLRYEFNYSCLSTFNASAYFSITQNTSVAKINNLTCDNTTRISNGTYTHGTEGNYNISLNYNVPYEYLQNSRVTKVQNFTSDLNPPRIYNLTLNIVGGFGLNNATAVLACNDTIALNLSVNMSLNGSSFYNQDIVNGQNESISVPVVDGFNLLTTTCSDLFSSVNSSYAATIYKTNFILIDELTGALFDLNNLTDARVYLDDNHTFYDFKNSSSSNFNFTALDSEKLRFVFTYNDDREITRYIDVTVIPDPARICVFDESQTEYEQLIISSTEKKVLLKNVFANCYVAADYTRFAYQDTQSLKAYTINSNYIVQIEDSNNNLITLASLDGSISTFINLDILEFNANQFSIDIISDSVTFTRHSQLPNLLQINYKNLNEDNTDLDIDIVRLDTNEVVYTDYDLSNVNSFTLYFDYSTLNNVTNETLFMFQGTKYNAAGSSVFKRYFNIQGSSGLINNGVAFAISLLLVIFGMTFTISRISFSWFGVIILGGAIAITTFAIGNWYITLLQTMETIMLVYVVIIMWTQNYPTLT